MKYIDLAGEDPQVKFCFWLNPEQEKMAFIDPIGLVHRVKPPRMFHISYPYFHVTGTDPSGAHFRVCCMDHLGKFSKRETSHVASSYPDSDRERKKWKAVIPPPKANTPIRVFGWLPPVDQGPGFHQEGESPIHEVNRLYIRTRTGGRLILSDFFIADFGWESESGLVMKKPYICLVRGTLQVSKDNNVVGVAFFNPSGERGSVVDEQKNYMTYAPVMWVKPNGTEYTITVDQEQGGATVEVTAGSVDILNRQKKPVETVAAGQRTSFDLREFAADAPQPPAASTAGPSSAPAAAPTGPPASTAAGPDRTASEIVAMAVKNIGYTNDSPGGQTKDFYYCTDGNWSAEFISCVYAWAGCPIGGGVEGQPWLYRTASDLMHLYIIHGAYFSKNEPDWPAIRPQPGDFALIGRADGRGGLTKRRQAALVERVDADGTLHTIEGDNQGRPVARYRYPNFITNMADNGPANGIVLGIGLRHGPFRRVQALLARCSSSDDDHGPVMGSDGNWNTWWQNDDDDDDDPYFELNFDGGKRTLERIQFIFGRHFPEDYRLRLKIDGKWHRGGTVENNESRYRTHRFTRPVEGVEAVRIYCTEFSDDDYFTIKEMVLQCRAK
jgi:hypothetical protein